MEGHDNISLPYWRMLTSIMSFLKRHEKLDSQLKCVVSQEREQDLDNSMTIFKVSLIGMEWYTRES